MARRTRPAKSASSSASIGKDAAARVLLVDSNRQRATANRALLETRIGAEIECAGTGDEALDVLGAAAQQLDGVVLWPWLTDDAQVDFVGILRRCNSPLKLMAVAALSPERLGRAGRLAGVSVVEDDDTRGNVGRGLETLLSAGEPIADIVANRRVPQALTRKWAQAIYGAAPGQHFHSPLD